MDNDDTRRRINDVFSKWDRGPPTEALEGARGGPTTTRSQHWDNAFDASEVSASRVERRMAQAKPRKRRGGKNVGGGRSHGGGSGGFGAPAPLGSLPPFTPSFSFATGLNLPNKFHLEVDHQFCGRCCSDCTPFSREKFYTDDVPSSGFKNLLDIRQGQNAPVLSQLFPFAYQSLACPSSHCYTALQKEVLSSNRVKACIEEVVKEELGVRGNEVASSDDKSVHQAVASRALSIVSGLYSCVRTLGIRFHSWLLYRVFTRLMTSLDIRYGQLKMLKEASKDGIPIVIVPTHRSHLDSLVMLFMMFNSEVKLPRIAAGDNLNLPFLASVIRNHGSFLIRRRLDPDGARKDTLYRGILQEYMEQLLKANETLLFFIEGGRSRSGKVGLPKAGLLSVIVDAVMEGVVPDVYLVPASIAYDRTLDSEAFAQELMGRPKQAETLRRAVTGLWQMLTTSVGHARVDLAQPFSVNEYIRGHSGKGSKDISARLLSQTEPVNSDHRSLVQSLAHHVSASCQQVTPVMSTHILACLLLVRFRHGVYLSKLSVCYKWLQECLLARGWDVGYSSTPKTAMMHACEVLADVVEMSPIEVNDDGEVVDDFLVKPVLTLPKVFLLATSASQVLPAFLNESVLACSLHSIVFSNRDYIENVSGEISLILPVLLKAAKELCNLLRREFIFHSPCQSLHESLTSGIARFEVDKVLAAGALVRVRPEADIWDEQENRNQVSKMKVLLNPLTRQRLAFLQSMLSPLLEIYWLTARQLCVLLDEPKEESVFIAEVLEFASQRVERGLTKYTEIVAIDPVKNAVKVFLSDGILSTEEVSGTSGPCLCLADEYCSQGAIDDLACKINDFIA